MHIGGSARNYPAGFVSRAPGYGPSARAAQPYFYAASGVVVDIRYCRDEYVPRLLVNIRAITSMESRRLAASTTPHSDQ
jgi:hypothetical protein